MSKFRNPKKEVHTLLSRLPQCIRYRATIMLIFLKLDVDERPSEMAFSST